MNEEQWVTATDLSTMIKFLDESGRVNERKLRLYAVACCSGIWHLITQECCRTAVEAAVKSLMRIRALGLAVGVAYFARRAAVRAAGEDPKILPEEVPGGFAAEAALLREIFGPLPSARSSLSPTG
jgi:hypothetical protein